MGDWDRGIALKPRMAGLGCGLPYPYAPHICAGARIWQRRHYRRMFLPAASRWLVFVSNLSSLPYPRQLLPLQAYVSRARVESFSLTADMMYVSSNAPRIIRAIFEICLRYAVLPYEYIN